MRDRKMFSRMLLVLALCAALTESAAATAWAAGQDGPGATEREEKYVGKVDNENMKVNIMGN